MDPQKQTPPSRSVPPRPVNRGPPPRRAPPKLPSVPTEPSPPHRLPTRTSPQQSRAQESKGLPPSPAKLSTEATVYDCKIGDGRNGIMVSLGVGSNIFLDDHLKEQMGKSQDVKLDLKLIFRGDISKIVEFLPPEQSNKLVESIDRLFLFRVKIRKLVKPPDSNLGKKIVHIPATPEFAPEEETKEEEDKRLAKYQEILQKANTMDFSEFERMNIVRVDVGRDNSDRPIILFKERGFTKDQVDRLIYFILHKIDSVANSEYTLVWCIYNSRKKGEKVFKPGLQWLLNVYRSLSRKVRKNLKSLYLIHPTLLYNVIIKFFKPFVSKKFWKKLHICNSVADIEKRKEITLENCPLPPGTCCYNIEKYREKCDLPMFCVPIKTVFMRRENRGRNIPTMIDKCLDYLGNRENHNYGNVIPIRVEGIFRRAGNKAVIDDLRTSFDHGYNVDLAHADIHAISGVVKLWFRELTEPIVPFNLYPEFLKLHPDHIEDTQKIKYVCSLVPMPNFAILKRIFLFLKRVSTYKDENKMDEMNLAIVFGPNVLRTNTEDRLKILTDSQKVMNIVHKMVEKATEIFEEEEDSGGPKKSPVADLLEKETEGEEEEG